MSNYKSDLHNPDLKNPALEFEELRSKCPVSHTDGFGGGWNISRHEDIVKTTLDPGTFSNAGAIRYPHMPRFPFEADPPLHTPYRKVMQEFFTAKKMITFADKVRPIAIELLEPIVNRGYGDIAKEVHYPMPVRGIIAFLNLPDKDWPRIMHWAEELYYSAAEGDFARRNAAAEELEEYCRAAVADRRENMLDPKEDLLSKMLHSSMEDDSGTVTENLIVGTLHLLLTAGHESTTSSLGIIVNYLATHPEDRKRLQEEPELIPNAIEEILRYESPVQFHPRYVTKDTVIQGQEIKAGEKVFLQWGSGNRDEEVFPDADQCIIDRDTKKSLVFGSGIHKCIGAPIARTQLRVVIEELLKRTGSFQLNGEIQRIGYTRYGVSSLPILFDK
ncbi:cytochrome P450 [Bacillus tuaregi]|uniref:cytochrome P450 n=1 Tax=Bacillus tuaregi TaxID=1816695 RepID=UPI0008F7F7A1|nr:cytochrome P450 [Bacillus tuaregi]